MYLLIAGIGQMLKVHLNTNVKIDHDWNLKVNLDRFMVVVVSSNK